VIKSKIIVLCIHINKIQGLSIKIQITLNIKSGNSNAISYLNLKSEVNLIRHAYVFKSLGTRGTIVGWATMIQNIAGSFSVDVTLFLFN
jgi:hypothetical protein